MAALMTDANGNVWAVGDLVLSKVDNTTQGLVTGIISQRILEVQFPGHTPAACFVSQLTRILQK